MENILYTLLCTITGLPFLIALLSLNLMAVQEVRETLRRRTR